MGEIIFGKIDQLSKSLGSSFISFGSIINEQMGLKNLRHELLIEPTEFFKKENVPFEEIINNSFLPEIIRLAKDRNIKLVFFNVKTRHSFKDHRINNSADERDVNQLKYYIDKNGQTLIDETQNSEIIKAWYADGDHVDQKFKDIYTEYFFKNYAWAIK